MIDIEMMDGVFGHAGDEGVGRVHRQDPAVGDLRAHERGVQRAGEPVVGEVVGVDGSTGQEERVLGSDHAGVDLKRNLIDDLQHQGHQVLDVGTYTSDPVDYPDYAEKVGRAHVANVRNAIVELSRSR